MKREECMDCVCLVEGDAGEWICDEEGKPVEEIEVCPEITNEIDKLELLSLLRNNY